MKNSDVERIQRILDGDDSAFSELVNKYQKPVHALVWRKLGDFHIAEEITQDTFLKAYQRLATLKKPQRFSSWLYVIAANNCSSWLRKKRLKMQSMEETSVAQLEKATYSGYVVEENERTAAETQREVVKKLLAKLQESERTVMTLHYFSEMSAAEIGEFLGVSVNTIKSRLRRAQQRLRREEPIIREALENFQITPHLTENIMREVSRMKPAIPSGSKPLIPWALSAAMATILFLIIGVGSQYLARFQKPYNVDAQSEATIEIIDVSIVLDTKAKPDLRNQAGRLDTVGKRVGAGTQISDPVVLAAAKIEKETRPPTEQQWIQAGGPEGGSISGLLASANGDVYAASPIGIYRLSPDAPAWTLVNTAVPIADSANSERYGLIPMAERNGTLYLVSTREIFASTDRGETWMSLGVRPKGTAVDLVITDEALYLGLRDGGVFRSMDAGQRWSLLTDGASDRKIFALTAIENIVFVGTNRGLYRLNSGMWEKVSVGTSKSIHSLAVSGDDLYVGTGPDLHEFAEASDPQAMGQMLGQMLMGAWEIFHSADLGNSWIEITPAGKSIAKIVSPGIKVIAAGDTLLALGIGGFRSTDRGQTWREIAFGGDSATFSLFPAVAVNENTFFKVGPLGSTRSIDGGTSWHPYMTGIVGTRILDLVGFKNRLYANTGITVAKSIDDGASWEPVAVKSELLALEPLEKRDHTRQLHLPTLAIADDMFYVIAPEKNELHVFRMSADGNTLISIEGMPVLGESPPRDAQDAELESAYEAVMADDDADNSEKAGKLTGIFSSLFESLQKEKEEEAVVAGGFAVSGETFYVEYKRRLFRWKPGEPEWVNTGLMDAGEQPDNAFERGFKLAVWGETVYVGKRDGRLFRSLDGGETWKDLTSNLPLHFARFNEIVFADSTVYVATDAGVLASQTGEDWRAIADKAGTHIIMDRLVMTDTRIYGAGNAGVYQLNNRNRWEKISPEVPDSVINLVINENKLYIATKQRGIFHVSLQEKNN